MTPAKASITFTPLQGLLAVGKLVAGCLGVSEHWAGHDGIEGVLHQKLVEVGIPEHPIQLSGPDALTPRQIAERSGFIRKARPQRRLKAK